MPVVSTAGSAAGAGTGAGTAGGVGVAVGVGVGVGVGVAVGTGVDVTAVSAEAVSVSNCTGCAVDDPERYDHAAIAPAPLSRVGAESSAVSCQPGCALPASQARACRCTGFVPVAWNCSCTAAPAFSPLTMPTSDPIVVCVAPFTRTIVSVSTSLAPTRMLAR